MGRAPRGQDRTLTHTPEAPKPQGASEVALSLAAELSARCLWAWHYLIALSHR